MLLFIGESFRFYSWNTLTPFRFCWKNVIERTPPNNDPCVWWEKSRLQISHVVWRFISGLGCSWSFKIIEEYVGKGQLVWPSWKSNPQAQHSKSQILDILYTLYSCCFQILTIASPLGKICNPNLSNESRCTFWLFKMFYVITHFVAIATLQAKYIFFGWSLKINQKRRHWSATWCFPVWSFQAPLSLQLRLEGLEATQAWSCGVETQRTSEPRSLTSPLKNDGCEITFQLGFGNFSGANFGRASRDFAKLARISGFFQVKKLKRAWIL